WCDLTSHTCKSDLANGQGCVAGSQCQSSFCVEGVCCNSACDGICQACAAANKMSGVDDGTCGLAAAGKDPHEVCPDEGPNSCKRDGVCDGQGACRLYASGTACGATTCNQGTQTGYACSGTGSCLLGPVPCGAYGCVGSSCASSCTTDADCAPNY